MSKHMMSIDPLQLDETYLGVQVLVTLPSGKTVAGGISDIVRVEPDGWRRAAMDYDYEIERAGQYVRKWRVAGCILWIGGQILVLTSTSHVLAEATPTDGVS